MDMIGTLWQTSTRMVGLYLVPIEQLDACTFYHVKDFGTYTFRKSDIRSLRKLAGVIAAVDDERSRASLRAGEGEVMLIGF